MGFERQPCRHIHALRYLSLLVAYVLIDDCNIYRHNSPPPLLYPSVSTTCDASPLTAPPGRSASKGCLQREKSTSACREAGWRSWIWCRVLREGKRDRGSGSGGHCGRRRYCAMRGTWGEYRRRRREEREGRRCWMGGERRGADKGVGG